MTETTHYHFIGIGGIGMSGLAELLVRRGHPVTGSDVAHNDITRRLEALGVRIYQGHAPEQVGDAKVVVHTSAVKEDNPELAAARARGLTVLRRGEMQARLMDPYRQIAVTGAHGKTSTTAMTAAVLRAGGLDPTVLVGAVWDSLGSNAVLGAGQWFVAEADESDGSFTHLTPDISIITNLDREHLDFYRDLEHVKEVFAGYLANLPAGALVVAWEGDPHLQELLRDFRHRRLTYGLTPGADLWADRLATRGLSQRFRLWQRGRLLGEVRLPLAGPHYVLNALAAAGVALELGLPFGAVARGLADLGGLKRRLEVKGEVRGITVIDDYGHHPTEIAATLRALAQAFPGRRLLTAFQPHRYSRTEALLPDFFPVFEAAHLVFITEIYAASEPPRPGVSGRLIWEGVRAHGHPAAYFAPDQPTLAEALLECLRPGDVLLTLGAGDIWRLGEEVLRRLSGGRRRSSPAPAKGAEPCPGVHMG
ncbi:MAG: UDP-N-acetylmuramate--L-alanine ligase [Syntrophobacterales bacterium]|nr:UDP-N-acetylmuramate--L-alanine ligase [Syntrophobacterales bacterium]